jgi:hypothetical protein
MSGHSPRRRQDSHITDAGIVPAAIGLVMAPNMIHHHLRRRATAMSRMTPILPDGRWSTSMETLEDLLEAKKEQPHQDGRAPIAGVSDALGISTEPVEQADGSEADRIMEEDSVPSRKSTVS